MCEVLSGFRCSVLSEKRLPAFLFQYVPLSVSLFILLLSLFFFTFTMYLTVHYLLHLFHFCFLPTNVSLCLTSTPSLSYPLTMSLSLLRTLSLLLSMWYHYYSNTTTLQLVHNYTFSLCLKRSFISTTILFILNSSFARHTRHIVWMVINGIMHVVLEQAFLSRH